MIRECMSLGVATACDRGKNSATRMMSSLGCVCILLVVGPVLGTGCAESKLLDLWSGEVESDGGGGGTGDGHEPDPNPEPEPNIADIPPAECGNGIVEAGEVCDLGSENALEVVDGCRPDCTRPQPSIQVTTPAGSDADAEINLEQPAMIACAPTNRPLGIENAGYANLEITAIDFEGSAGSFLAESVELPLTLAPGEGISLDVNWGVGISRVEITSNAENRPFVDMGVYIAPDAAPTVGFLGYADGDVIDVGTEDVLVQAVVADDVDVAGTLIVEWLNGAEEVIGSMPAGSDGVTSYSWPAETRPSGDQTIMVRVTDSCGNVTTVPLSLCQQYLGKTLGVWLTPEGTTELTDENFLTEIISYTGTTTAAENYNYFSASAHPLVGPQPEGFETKVFFYEGTDGLAMSFFSGKDAQGTNENTTVKWDIRTTGNGGIDNVLVSDDRPETKRLSQSDAENVYAHSGTYRRNTDGAVIGPFSGEEFEIWVDVVQTGNNVNANFYSQNGATHPLMVTEEVFSSFAIAHRRDTACEETESELEVEPESELME